MRNLRPSIRSARASAPLLPALLLGASLVGACATAPPTDATDDGSIENAITARIAEEPRFGLAQITVLEEAGVVSIGGFVDSLEQQRLLDEVIADVERMDGVTRVESAVTVRSDG